MGQLCGHAVALLGLVWPDLLLVQLQEAWVSSVWANCSHSGKRRCGPGREGPAAEYAARPLFGKPGRSVISTIAYQVVRRGEAGQLEYLRPQFRMAPTIGPRSRPFSVSTYSARGGLME